MNKEINIEKELSYFELIKLDQETLTQLFLKTRSAIINGKRQKRDMTDIEIYNCYIEKAIEEKSI
jgi:hypothetical protein